MTDDVFCDEEVLGIDIGATKWMIASCRRSSRTVQGRVTDDALSVIRDILRAMSSVSSSPTAVGVSFAGDADSSGVITDWPSRPAWVGTPLVTSLSNGLTVPVVIADDGECAALGERCGAAVDLRAYLCLTFGSGIGGVVVLDGEARRSRSRSARTFGHVRVAGSTVPCRCGGAGCLQAVVLGTFPGRRTEEELVRGARDSALCALVADWGNVLGLDGVVLTGGLMGHAPGFATFLTNEIEKELTESVCTVRLSRTPHESALRGAQLMARRCMAGEY